MENAIDALKLAAAVIVFVIFISLAFMLFSQTKTTADSIFYTRDSQKYMEQEGLNDIIYISSAGLDTNREVTFEDLLPTLFRYHKENYAVTIIVNEGDSGPYKVLARYDNTTETVVNANASDIMNEESENETVNKELEYLDQNVNNFSVDGTPISVTWSIETLQEIYKIGRKNGSTYDDFVGAPWLSDETAILYRIRADLNKDGDNTQTYNGEYYKYTGKKLYGNCDGKKFKEIIKVIDNNKYVEIEGETDNKDYLEERLISKTEMIYIQAN